MGLTAYLRMDGEGKYALDVSTFPLNPVGSRLETPRRVLPQVVRDLVADPSNEAAALAALKAAQGFFDGTEAGINPPQFGDPLPRLRRKK